MDRIRMIMCLLLLSASGSIAANSCMDKADTYQFYDNKVAGSQINNIPSQYYVLSYTYSPKHCAKASKASIRAGGKNYLQCSKQNKFGYILHGLWPQGSEKAKKGYPRACLGDKPKIPRATLSAYLCMTPSVWLLQHEYEYHGTCMPTKALRTVQGYFNKAQQLHQQLSLPKVELANKSKSLQWWYNNNSHLKPGSVQFWKGGNEWQLCFNNKFESMTCPANKGKSNLAKFAYKSTHSKSKTKSYNNGSVSKSDVNKECLVKGNISKKSKKRLYFLVSHPQYQAVAINTNIGERCFLTQEDAVAAGWTKAP